MTNDDVFQETISKSNKIVNSIADEMGWNKHQSYQALRVVLHAFRDRLPVEEAVNFSAQLPILMKGVFFDTWDPTLKPIKFNRDEFLDFVSLQLPVEYEEMEVKKIVKTVLGVIFQHVDVHESEKIKKVLPEDISGLF